MKLGRQAEGGGLLQQFRTDQQVRRLLMTDLDGFPGGRYSGGQMAILTQALGEDRAKSRMGINDQNPLRMADGVINLGWAIGIEGAGSNRMERLSVLEA